MGLSFGATTSSFVNSRFDGDSATAIGFDRETNAILAIWNSLLLRVLRGALKVAHRTRAWLILVQ